MATRNLIDYLFEGYTGTPRLAATRLDPSLFQIGFEAEFILPEMGTVAGKEQFNKPSTRRWFYQHFGRYFNKGYGVEIHTEHGKSRGGDYDRWNIEPDGSVRTRYNDCDIELISPIMPLDKGLSSINDVFTAISAAHGETDSSCGLHVWASFKSPPGYIDTDKLVLLAGLKHSLVRFNRQDAGYAELNIDKDVVDQGELQSKIKALNSGLPSDITLLPHRGKDFAMYLGDSPEKFELRVAGGRDYHKKFDQVKDTIQRFCLALQAAADPAMFNREYLKLLSYMLAVSQPQDYSKMFLKIFNRGFPIKDLYYLRQVATRLVNFQDEQPEHFTVEMVKELMREYLNENFSTMDANDAKLSRLLAEYAVIGKKLSVSNPRWDTQDENNLAGIIYRLAKKERNP